MSDVLATMYDVLIDRMLEISLINRINDVLMPVIRIIEIL